MISMKTRGQRLITEALHMRTHMNVVTVTGLVLVEEVLYMIKKIGNMVITKKALFVLQ